MAFPGAGRPNLGNRAHSEPAASRAPRYARERDHSQRLAPRRAEPVPNRTGGPTEPGEKTRSASTDCAAPRRRPARPDRAATEPATAAASVWAGRDASPRAGSGPSTSQFGHQPPVASVTKFVVWRRERHTLGYSRKRTPVCSGGRSRYFLGGLGALAPCLGVAPDGELL